MRCAFAVTTRSCLSTRDCAVDGLNIRVAECCLNLAASPARKRIMRPSVRSMKSSAWSASAMSMSLDAFTATNTSQRTFSSSVPGLGLTPPPWVGSSSIHAARSLSRSKLTSLVACNLASRAER